MQKQKKILFLHGFYASGSCVLGNPHFRMSDFLRERIGNHQYKSPRADGKQDFTIDENLIKEFEVMEAHQFDCCKSKIQR